MSNNIYDILKKMQNLEAPKQALTESKTMSTVKELHNESKKEKLTVKGSIAEAVQSIESQLNEKYMGFKKTVAAIKKGGSAENPEAVAAAIGRKKYGKEKFQKAAAAGKKLGEDYQSDMKARDKASRASEFEKDLEFIQSGGAHRDTGGVDYDRFGNPAFDVDTRRKLEKGRTYPVYRHPGIGDGMPDRPVPKQMDEDGIDESGLQAYLGKKKYGKEGMTALQKAGREGASKEKMARIRAQHDKMDENGTVPPKHYGGTGPTGAAFDLYMAQRKEQLAAQKPKNEDMLSPAQKKFAALAEPKDKITYADKIAGAKKDKKDEGNEFSGELAQARAQGKDSFEVDGKTYPVKEGRSRMREGWEEMQKYLEKKRGPESKGGAGKKAGTRYGGSAQRDDDEETDGEGQAVVKKKGRPKGTGGGAKFSFKKPKD